MLLIQTYVFEAIKLFTFVMFNIIQMVVDLKIKLQISESKANILMGTNGSSVYIKNPVKNRWAIIPQKKIEQICP